MFTAGLLCKCLIRGRERAQKHERRPLLLNHFNILAIFSIFTLRTLVRCPAGVGGPQIRSYPDLERGLGVQGPHAHERVRGLWTRLTCA